MRPRFRDVITKDTWVAGPVVTALLLLATLVYLAVESAFNARLVNVLGALSIDQTHTDAISGLEFWGRVLSSAALGLALLSAYVAQSQKKQQPQPVRLLSLIFRRESEPVTWGIGCWSFALAIVVGSMLTLFHGERLWVEDRAEDVSADSRWWMFYAVRAVDALLISADQLEAHIRNDHHEPAQQSDTSPAADQGVAKANALITETSRLPKFKDVYLRDPAGFSLSQFSSADWRVWISIAPHALQNFAKTQRVAESQQEPMTPGDIQKRIEDALSEDADKLAVPLLDIAAFTPVRQCLDAIYDQSALRTRPRGFDPALCVTHAAALDQLQSSHPALWAALPEQCLLMDGEPRQFADFAMFRCAIAENDTKFRAIAQSAAESYLAAFKWQRAEIIAAYKADPRTLPEPVAARIVADLNIALARNSDLRATVALEDVAIENRERLPPCGRLGNQLLTRFRIARTSSDNLVESRVAAWLSLLDESYCNSFDTLIPDSPGRVDASLLTPRLEALRNAAQIGLDATLESAGIDRRIQLPEGWRIPHAADHAEWIRAELIAPLKQAMNQVIGEQLNASQSALPLLPDPATVTRREEFEDNPVVSNLFRLQLQNLTDSAFGCLGLMNLRGRLKVNDDLGQLMSSEGTAAFNKRAGNLLFENIFRTRLTGTVDDFELSGRCGTAGVTAYHRGYIPGFALLISLIGLIYHCRKAVLYVLRFARMPTVIRHLIAIAAVLLLLGWPLLKKVDALKVRETDIIVQRYAKSHGPAFEFGVRWLIKAQALYHPTTDTLYRTVFEPLGINFTREIEPAGLDLQQALIDQSCGMVPQIRQTPQYQVLRTVITHRNLCLPEDASHDRIANR